MANRIPLALTGMVESTVALTGRRRVAKSVGSITMTHQRSLSTSQPTHFPSTDSQPSSSTSTSFSSSSPAILSSSHASVRPDGPAFPPTSRPTSLASSASSSSTTPEQASQYFSSLFNLPSHKSFPGDLALRMLTHKSYRSVHILSQQPQQKYNKSSYSPQPSERAGSVPHNERLAFLGKRAFMSYLYMFLHEASLNNPTGKGLEGLGLGLGLSGSSLEERVEGWSHGLNLGREIGRRWNLEDVMRWQSASRPLPGVSSSDQASGSLSIQGETVQAIIGGTMMHFGSPAAQRLFHLHVLPHLLAHPRNQILREMHTEIKGKYVNELSGGIVVP